MLHAIHTFRNAYSEDMKIHDILYTPKSLNPRPTKKSFNTDDFTTVTFHDYTIKHEKIF